VRLPGLLSASRGYLRTRRQAHIHPTLSNATRHLESAFDLREKIVEGRTPEGLFQLGEVVFKSVRDFGSNIMIVVRRVLR